MRRRVHGVVLGTFPYLGIRTNFPSAYEEAFALRRRKLPSLRNIWCHLLVVQLVKLVAQSLARDASGQELSLLGSLALTHACLLLARLILIMNFNGGFTRAV